MRTLILNDGTVLNDSYCFEASGVLWVYIGTGYTLAEVFNLLNDPEKTETIVCVQYGAEATFEGYTHLYCISEEIGGTFSAGIKKGVQ